MKLPPPFMARMQAQLGDDYAAFDAALQEPAVISLRRNPAKPFADFSSYDAVPWCKQGFYLNQRPLFTLDPLLHAGAYYVQEASSMFIEQIWQQQENATGPLRVLDLCAAPGGKSTHLLSLMSDDSVLVSNELIAKRNLILRENLCKWGAPNVIVTQAEAAHFAALPQFFDVILVDAPCSGEGLFRKDPHATTEWSENSVQQCALRQSAILQQVLPALRTGGLLIYCTCTYEPVENLQQLLPLLSHCEPLRMALQTDWGVSELQAQGCYGYAFYPHRTRGEGFFAAAMRKQKHEELNPTGVSAPFPWQHAAMQALPFVPPTVPLTIYQRGESLVAATAAVADALQQLSRAVMVRAFGVEAGEMKGGEFQPAHALALSTFPLPAPDLPLSKEEALQYLRCYDLKKEAVPGFNTVSYQGARLGWVKAQAQRTRNLYPKEWRIRM